MSIAIWSIVVFLTIYSHHYSLIELLAFKWKKKWIFSHFSECFECGVNWTFVKEEKKKKRRYSILIACDLADYKSTNWDSHIFGTMKTSNLSNHMTDRFLSNCEVQPCAILTQAKIVQNQNESKRLRAKINSLNK